MERPNELPVLKYCYFYTNRCRMKNLILLLLVLATGCQTTKIKNTEYKISDATTELGSIGHATSYNNISNDYTIHAIPVLENKIRLDVQVLPFNKDINEIYLSKQKNSPTAIKIDYVDSLPQKPRFVTISIMDINAFAGELNAPHNKGIFTYLKDAKKAVVITSLALVLPEAELAKIKLSDTAYLICTKDKKCTIALYSQGKKTDVLDISKGTVLAYTLGKFCWAVNDKAQPYIGDIVKDDKACKGNTSKKIKEKEETNLFKM
jgi:hypothetical protein